VLTMRDHTVADYTELHDMDATDVGELGEDDRGCLEELGRYLIATDAWPRFAIWLLHKHFEPAPGEIFVERAIAGPRKTETTPIERSAFPEQGLSTTAIRFRDAVSSGVAVIGMEFAEPADFGSTSPLTAADEAVLAGIAVRLEARGKTERFGVRLIRDPLGLSEHEMLLETCDSANRTLHCEVSTRDGVHPFKTVETSWQWKLVPGEAGPTTMQYCASSCGLDANGSHESGHFSTVA
jgi:hypothetical protein